MNGMTIPVDDGQLDPTKVAAKPGCPDDGTDTRRRRNQVYKLTGQCRSFDTLYWRAGQASTCSWFRRAPDSSSNSAGGSAVRNAFTTAAFNGL
jgi:hypothetical protein